MVVFTIGCCHDNSLQYTPVNENETLGVLPKVKQIDHF